MLLLLLKALISIFAASRWSPERTYSSTNALFGFYEKSEDLDKRFDLTLDGGVYDAKFIFSEVGYNFQSTELNGAFGLVQLGRLG